MVFPGAHLFRAPIWCPSGGWRHARGREHCRGEPGSALPLCARITGLNREVSEGKADVCPRSFFSLRGPQGAHTGKTRGGFSRMHRDLDGWMLARAPASPAQGLHHHGPRYFNFSYFCTMCVALRNLDIVDQNWLRSVIFPFFC